MQQVEECKSRRRDKHKLSTTAKFVTQGCGFFFVMWKVTQTSEGQQVLMSTVKALEFRERKRYAIHKVWGFYFAISQTHIYTRFKDPEVQFHA